MAENNIITDLQTSGEALIELFELDLGTGTTLYFHPGTDENYDNLVFDGNTYVALPMALEGVDILSDGANNRPTLTIANVTTLLKANLNDNNFRMGDLVGTRFKRRRTLEKYLGTPAETFEFPAAAYIIDRIASENNIQVDFELASPFDVEGVQLPSRIIVGKYCSWIYQGKDIKNCGGCSWNRESSFYVNDEESLFRAFFDTEDRPLIPGETNSLTPPSPVPAYWQYIIPAEGSWSGWASPSPAYTRDSLVSYQGNYYRSDFDNNSSEPSPSNNLWTQLFLYTEWTGEPDEPGEDYEGYLVNDYVKHTVNLGTEEDPILTEVIWKCAVSHIIPQEPKFLSPYWTRADSCSKTLGGCKSRFQFVQIEGTSIPSFRKNTNNRLPFGAFPGSVKFQ